MSVATAIQDAGIDRRSLIEGILAVCKTCHTNAKETIAKNNRQTVSDLDSGEYDREVRTAALHDNGRMSTAYQLDIAGSDMLASCLGAQFLGENSGEILLVETKDGVVAAILYEDGGGGTTFTPGSVRENLKAVAHKFNLFDILITSKNEGWGEKCSGMRVGRRVEMINSRFTSVFGKVIGRVP